MWLLFSVLPASSQITLSKSVTCLYFNGFCRIRKSSAPKKKKKIKEFQKNHRKNSFPGHFQCEHYEFKKKILKFARNAMNIMDLKYKTCSSQWYFIGFDRFFKELQQSFIRSGFDIFFFKDLFSINKYLNRPLELNHQVRLRTLNSKLQVARGVCVSWNRKVHMKNREMSKTSEKSHNKQPVALN